MKIEFYYFTEAIDLFIGGSGTFCMLLVKSIDFMMVSKVIMLVWVVDIMCKSLLLKVLELPYNDNLIRCDTISKF